VTKTRLVVYLSIFMAMAGYGITVPIMPFIARDLGASPLGVSLLVSLFALTQFISGPFWGNLSDRYGRKRILVAGLSGYALSFFLAGMSRSLPALIGSRALGGLLSAAMFPSCQALIADMTAPADRGPAMAAMGAWVNLGFLLGPVIGGVLAPVGNAVAMTAAGGVVVVTAILAATGLREPGTARPAAPTGRGWPSLADVALAARSPIAPYLSLTFAISFGQGALTALLAYFVIDRFGGTARDAATIFTAVGLASFLAQTLLVGRLIRRFGEHRLALAAVVVCTAGFVSLVPATSVPAAVAAAMLTGLGSSILRPCLTSATSLLTPLPQGLTMGLQSSLDSLGRMLGPTIGGWFYGFGVTLPFWSSAAVLAGVGLGVARPRRRKQDETMA
jgi:MFS family permease